MTTLDKYTNLIESLHQQAREQDTYLVCRLQTKRSKTVEAVEQKINEVRVGRMQGIGLHLFDRRGHSTLTSTDNLNDSTRVSRLLEQAISSLKAAEEQNFTRNTEVFGLNPERNSLPLPKNFDLDRLTTSEIEQKLLDLNRKIAAIGKDLGVENGLKITTRFLILQEGWEITRSDGTDVCWELPKSILMARITYGDGKNKADDTLPSTGSGWEALLDPEKQRQFLAEAAYTINILKESINKGEYPAGNYPLLIDAALGGLLAHEAFGHCAESDAIYNEDSVIGTGGQLDKGAKVASPAISVIDETKKGTWGFQPYSAFGIPREKVTIVKDGHLQESIGDLLSGKKVGDQVRGASRIQSYSDTPIPRMSQTTICVNDPLPSIGKFATPQEIQQALLTAGLLKDRVLVLRRARGGGSVDTHAGTFMFGFAYLYEITPNSVRLFRGSSFSGQTLEALKAIQAGFGKVDASGAGSCGKGGQRAPTTSGANEFLLIGQTPHVTLGGVGKKGS